MKQRKSLKEKQEGMSEGIDKVASYRPSASLTRTGVSKTGLFEDLALLAIER